MRSLDSLAVHAGRDGLTGQGIHAVPIDLSTTAPLPSVADAGLVLPPAMVPPFLELGRDSGIMPVLSELVGERGRWLVDLDEDWSTFLPRGAQAREVAALRRLSPRTL